MERQGDLLNGKLRVINIGLPEFANSLEEQGIEVVHVDWAPPATEPDNVLDSILDQIL